MRKATGSTVRPFLVNAFEVVDSLALFQDKIGESLFVIQIETAGGAILETQVSLTQRGAHLKSELHLRAFHSFDIGLFLLHDLLSGVGRRSDDCGRTQQTSRLPIFHFEKLRNVHRPPECGS